jgi:hypothetical protein
VAATIYPKWKEALISGAADTGPDGTTVINRAAVTVVDVTVGAEVRKAFEYDWQAGDTAASGLHRAEFEATFPGARALTYPNRGFITIDISADLG